jgi:branched-chain amino acid transport system permease protein
MLDFLQMVVSGIAVGSSYALMGLAMVIIYKTSEVVNFAQGEMALISTFLTYMVLEYYGFPFYVAFPGALVFALILGFVLEFAVLRRAKEPNILGMIIITIGLEMILLGFVSWKFGAEQKTMPFPITPYDSVTIGGVFVSSLEVLTFVVALTVMVILFLFLKYSKLGVAMKATQQNQVAARLQGIRTNRILMITKGFAGAVMGGMTSLPGSVFGAYAIGIIENLFGGYISIEFKSVVAFVIIVLALCIKPSGLFARHYVKKV